MPPNQANSIRKVAIIGVRSHTKYCLSFLTLFTNTPQASGKIGSHILDSILATGKHEVTVLTRLDSEVTLSPKATVVRVDYTSEEALTSALRGHDFLIITLSASAAPGTHASMVSAAAKAGIQWIMPNYYAFGLGPRASTLASEPLLSSFGAYIDDVKNVSVTEGGVKPNSISLACGFWYEVSLAQGEQWFGFDIKNRRVTLYDEGKVKINTSTWEQCGRAVASLVSLPISFNGDYKPTLEGFKNEGIHISSFLISQREMLDSLHRVMGTTDQDWTIAKEPVEERYQKGLQELHGGDRRGFAKAMYARLFFPGGGGDFETGYGLDNEKLGLPQEDLDEATRRAVERAETNALSHA